MLIMIKFNFLLLIFGKFFTPTLRSQHSSKSVSISRRYVFISFYLSIGLYRDDFR